MPSRHHLIDAEDSSQNLLQCIARNILVCPCHEGAAREFNELPEAAQDEVWNDLTGAEAQTMKAQGKAPVEEPQHMVEAALYQLSSELETLAAESSSVGDDDGGRLRHPGLRMALTDFPSYISGDRAFRLKFLRAERFDVAAAAERMAIHFDCKLELWGPERLGREIYLSDMDEDDLYSLRLGFVQILPQLDHGGRKILFYYKALSNCYRRRENILRAVWYLGNSISTDESVQRLGVVNVVYNNGGYPENGMDWEKSRRLAQVFRGLPIRFDSFFVCVDDSPWLNVAETFSLIVNRFLRVRMRVLQGRSSRHLSKELTFAVLQRQATAQNNYTDTSRAFVFF